jgi:hypothetical protein
MPHFFPLERFEKKTAVYKYLARNGAEAVRWKENDGSMT